jgi:hydrogenase maturation protease
MNTLIVGLGNPILSDDGIGIRVAQSVRERVTDSEVEFLEASLGGLRLAEQLEGYDRAILIDAIQTRGGQPGAIYRLTLDDIPSYNADGAHDASLKTALELFRRQGGQVPSEVAVIAVEAVNMLDFGETLTPAVEAAIPAAVDAVLIELDLSMQDTRFHKE